jgi:hypothetical protein
MLEFPLTWADASNNGTEVTGPVRFAPFINFTNNLHIDFSEKAGLLTGFSLRNLGFIYDVDASTRIKARSYNIGIPIGFKFGDMDRAYFYAGYEVEFPVNFKQKTFVNEEKTKYNKWFSDQVPIQQSITAGVQLPYGANIKFKYYFTNFFNKDFDGSDSNGNPTKPYENFDVNVFYVSLNVYLLRNTTFYYSSY